MLNITNYQRNAKQNYNEASPHTGQNGHHQKFYKQQIGEGIEKRGLSYIVGGIVNWYSHSREQNRGSAKN